MSETKPCGLYVEADPDQNTIYNTGTWVQRVTDTGKFLYVEDPQLGAFTLGEGNSDYSRFVYDFMTTPGMYRSEGVSQLCKDEASATIPNTALFTRHSGMVALLGIIEHFAERQKLSDEQKIALILKYVGDDSAHTFYSHATELARQAWGGPETRHESQWPTYARHGGTVAVLQKHKVKVDDQLQMPNIVLPPWPGAEAPDVNSDRFQFGTCEGGEWYDNEGSEPAVRERVRSTYSLDNLDIDKDGYFAFKDKDTALVYSKILLLEATEHWNDPINRIQLYLIVQAAQRLVSQRRFPWMEAVDQGYTRIPDWYMYGIDQDVVDALGENHGHTDPTLYAIHGVLAPIAAAERKRFYRYKQKAYGAFLLDDAARDYPSEHLQPRRVEFGIAHPSVAITMEPSTEEERKSNQKMPLLAENNGSIHYTLMPLKNRYVDPRVMMRDGTSRPLSEIDQNYASLLKQQQMLQGMKTNVELVFAKRFRDDFLCVIGRNTDEFNELYSNQDFTEDQKRRVIELAADRAKSAAIAAGRLIMLSS